MISASETIFCRKCRALALANLEGVPMCPACLMVAVKTSRDPYLVSKITPLQVARYRVRGIVKSGKRVGVMDKMRSKAKSSSSSSETW